MVSFGSSGIRGVFGDDITPELFLNLGRVVGSRYGRIVLGRDVRMSGLTLSKAFISGALSSGAHLDDGGVLSTPTLAFASKNYDCGAMITASHNPPEYNGIKLWNSTGIAFDEEQQTEIEESLDRRLFKKCSWEHVKESASREDLISLHAEAILANFDPIKLKVAVDCGCGSAGTITPYVLREIGCEVVALNAQQDGRFPGRPSEPAEKNLELLMKTVPAIGADLGLAHDGDGDRVVAVDENGNYVGGDHLLPLLASKVATKSIVVPIDTSMSIDDLLPDAKVWRTRVGDVYVAQEIQRREAEFGGESSGTFIFPKWGLFPDGIYTALFIASIVAEEKLSSQIERLPSFITMKESFGFDASRRDEIISALDGQLSSFPEAEIELVDGWRVNLEDGWGLVRLSGTEPKVRVLAEAREKQRVKQIFDSLVSKIEAVLK